MPWTSVQTTCECVKPEAYGVTRGTWTCPSCGRFWDYIAANHAQAWSTYGEYDSNITKTNAKSRCDQ